MAKFTNLGYVGVPKKDPKKRYIKTGKGVTLIIKTADGTELTLPEGSFISMMEPKLRKGQSEEEFEQMKQWKRFDLLVVTDE